MVKIDRSISVTAEECEHCLGNKCSFLNRAADINYTESNGL
jgi:hypothetical protein